MVIQLRPEPALRLASYKTTVRVLIVEDVAAVGRLITAALHSEGMVTEVAASGVEAIAFKRAFRPDIVLIDLGLPDMDGFELLQRFAQDGDCGVIVVTADSAEASRIAGLENGADDYIVKPPPLRELAARIRAVHRRLARPEAAAEPYSGPRIVLDAPRRCLTGPGAALTSLTEAEFAALETLIEADNTSVSREWLGRVALKRPLGVDDRSVDQLVLKLRRKLALHGVMEQAILSSRGLGYLLPEPGRFIISMGQPTYPASPVR